MAIVAKGRIYKVTETAPPEPTGSTILVSPLSAGGNFFLEDTEYASGIHIPPSLRDGWGSNYGTGWYTKTAVSPGDLILVDNVAWGRLELFGIKGTAANPIWIRPKDDSVITFTEGIRLNDCEHVYVDGMPASTGWIGGPRRVPTESESLDYRFRMAGTNPNVRYIGMTIYGRCQSVHVRGVRMTGTWYGLQAKTDPMCYTEYNFPAWNLKDITFKHFWIEDCTQDAIYWGNSSHVLKSDDPVAGRDITCDTVYIDDDPNYLPMKMEDTEVAYGYIARAGRQGIVSGGCWFGKHKIHDIKFRHLGYELNNGQGECIGDGGMNRKMNIWNIDADYTWIENFASFGNETWVHDCVFNHAGQLDANYAIETDLAGFLTPTTDLAALDASRSDLEVSGDIVKNISSGGMYNIAMSTKTYYPTDSTKVVYLYNIQLGENTRPGPVEGTIRFDDYGPAGMQGNWLTTNVVANCTRISDGGAATITRFTYLGSPWPEYTTDINDVPPVP
jgi:hypothetical protein